MKRLATLALVILASVQAYAAPSIVHCMKNESDLACANRVVLQSGAMDRNFITVDSPERSMMFPAIFAHKPSGARVLKAYSNTETGLVAAELTYPVDASDVSNFTEAAFTVTIQKTFVDGAHGAQLIDRSIDADAIALVGGDLDN